MEPSAAGAGAAPGSESESSAFLLLSSSAPGQNQIYNVPRPRFAPLLALVAVADLSTTIFFAASDTPSPPGLSVKFLWAWGILRPALIFAIAASVRIREYDRVVLGQVFITAVVALYHFNELVQARPDSDHSTPPPHNSTTHIPSPPLDPLLRPGSWNPIPLTRFILLSLFFSILHYVLFAVFVGIRRRQNPFAGRRGAVWREQGWEGVEESVSAEGDLTRVRSTSRGRERAASFRDVDEIEELGLSEEEGGSDEEEPGSDESDDEDLDEDEIVDMPRPGDRIVRRPSRASFRERVAAEEAEEDLEEETSSFVGSRSRERGGLNDLRNATRYGSVKSLAGI